MNMKSQSGFTLGVLAALFSAWVGALAAVEVPELPPLGQLVLSKDPVALGLQSLAAAKIVLPAPENVIQQLDPKLTDHLVGLAGRIAASATAGAADLYGTKQRGWAYVLYGCRSADGSLHLLDNAIAAAMRVLHEPDGVSKSYQIRKFYEKALLFRAETEMREDGSQILVGLSFHHGLWYGKFEVSLEGKVRYWSPDQLTPESQTQMRRSLAFWQSVPASAIDPESISVGSLRFPLECSPSSGREVQYDNAAGGRGE